MTISITLTNEQAEALGLNIFGDFALSLEIIRDAFTSIKNISTQATKDAGESVIADLGDLNAAILDLVVRISAKHNIDQPEVGDLVYKYGEWQNWNSSSYDC